MHPAPDRPDLDLKSAENIQHPFPVYRWLRDQAPVHWSESLTAWVVTRYADVVDVFGNPQTFSSDRFRRIDERYASQRPAVQAVAEVLGHWLVFRDPPDHDRLRGLLQSSFTPKTLESSRERIQRTADTLLDRVVARGTMDFIREVAFPLPATVIAGLMGAPEDDLEAIKAWSDRLASYLGGAVDARDNFTEASAGVAALVRYFDALLRERERRPSDDLMTLMLRAEHQGDRLTHDEVVANCVLLLFAGHETTTNLLGNGLFHLLRHPAQAALLRADPSLGRSAGATWSCRSWRRRTATRASSRIRTRSTSAALQSATSPSPRACTSASAHGWRASRRASYSTPSSGDSRTSSWRRRRCAGSR